MNSLQEVFEQVKSYCTEHELIAKVAMETWINTMIPISLDGNQAIFEVDTEFQQGIILTNYRKFLETALQDIMSFPVNILVNIRSKMPEPEHSPEESQKNNEMTGYDYTFDTFIVGGSNEFAFAACKAIASDTAASYNPLFIYGSSGLGKTHLVSAIKNEINRNFPEKNAIYVTGETFGNELIKSIDKRDTTVFHDKYRQADVLIVDDIQFFSGKERMQEEFFHTFNKLHSEGKQIVITSDKSPKELKTLEERIRSRFECGLIADITAPDFETRYAIIRRKAEFLELKIPDEVTEF
ncbi:MAG: chromosomal replication initiator protein DnaA, partial [Oscillospiraceae bacterium]|nr:chromosomal replication initiator protein DnaA [Oscillospiraceae bacterium]